MKKVKFNDKEILKFLKDYSDNVIESKVFHGFALYFIIIFLTGVFGVLNFTDIMFINIPTWIYLAVSMVIFGLKRGGVFKSIAKKIIG